MWELIELREIRVFLVLAEEQHFGRTAERIGLTQSRVSQSLKSLEHKLGTTLVRRTSRRVALTEAGTRFRDEATPLYDGLLGVLARTHRASGRPHGTLRVGVANASSGGPNLLAIVDRFERGTDCVVEMVELPFTDRWGPLRRGEIHLMVSRLPLEQPDLVVGPVLAREARILAVARDHPLAEKTAVSIEDLADHQVARTDVMPRELAEAFSPSQTPSGRPILHVRLRAENPAEIVTMIARGKIVHPTVVSFATTFAHPNIVCLPIHDLPASAVGLVWRRRELDPAVREFVRVTGAVLRDAVAPGAAAILAAHAAAVANGDDGYLDPVTGLFVFTAVYHSERGTCCDSGCRHCPYVS